MIATNKIVIENQGPPAGKGTAAPFVQGQEGPKFGPYGGQFVPETLMPALAELEAAYLHYRADPDFQAVLRELLETYVGRPTPVTHVRRLSRRLGGAQIYL
jgi:tryptophan synthase beta chain